MGNKFLFFPPLFIESMAVIGYKGSCKPGWVTEVRQPQVNEVSPPVVARVALPDLPSCE